MITHNATHNEVIDDIFRNTHAPARRCRESAAGVDLELDIKKISNQ